MNQKSTSRLFPIMVLVAAAFLFGGASKVAALEWNVPEPLVSVHGFYEENENILFSDMKFVNIPQTLPSVDVYMVLKSVADDRTWYVTIDLLHLATTGDFHGASKVTENVTPYFQGLNFAELGLTRIDLPGFPIHVGDLPISQGEYLIMLALLEAGADPATASPIGNVAVSAVELPDIQFPHDPCDFNGNGDVEEWEILECEDKEFDPCDFNHNGDVEPWEKEECEDDEEEFEPLPIVLSDTND